MHPCYSQLHTCGGLGTVHFSVGRRTRPLGSSAFSCFICFIPICDPTFVYFKFIHLRSTSARFQPFPTSGDTCTAQVRSRTQQPLARPPPSSQKPRVTLDTASAQRNRSAASSGAAMSYFLHRCTPRLTIRNDIVRPSPPSLTAQECDH